MKSIKHKLIIAAFACLMSSCHKVAIGYLITEYASYEVDSLLVKSELDITGEDYDRHRLGIPWTSTAIEGLEGTMPILASIKAIKTDTGDATKLRQYLTVRGNGVFSIPVEHDIPPGRYEISLTFTNEGYSKSVDDLFTVIVK